MMNLDPLGTTDTELDRPNDSIPLVGLLGVVHAIFSEGII